MAPRISAADALEGQIHCSKVLQRMIADQHYDELVREESQFSGVSVADMHAGLDDDLGLVTQAQPMYWTRETTAAVLAIAPSVDLGAITCVRDLLYCDAAFCWFEEPLMQIDMGPVGGLSPVRALIWAWVYSKQSKLESLYLSAFCRIEAVTVPLAHCTVHAGDRLSEFVPPTGFGLASPEDREQARISHRNESLAQLQFVVCASMFLKQKLAVENAQRLERHARKRVAAAGWGSQDPTVSVIMLRERERRAALGPGGAQDGREYHWQWVVTAHVRQQPYPSRGITLPIIIGPHLKGPPDMPLKPRTTPVFMVNR